MVYYFKSTVIDPAATIYVGKDKFESPSCPSNPHLFYPPSLTAAVDEELIKFGWDCDVW